MSAIILSALYSAIRMATPLTFASLGGYCSERSGVINIALEGMMLMGAFTAAAVASATHSPFYGILGGIAGAVLIASVHSILCINLKGDQIISGIAVNLLAAGVPPVLCKAFYGQSGGTPMLEASERVKEWGSISPLIYLAIALAIYLQFIHQRTRFGQYLRFSGEHPESLKTQGVSVKMVRWKGVLLSGLFCGLAGTYLSIDHGSGFNRGMTAGRGYIALAALIIGNWTPFRAFLAALVFGFIESSQILLQGLKFSNGVPVPVQWIQMVPYIATLIILAGLFGKKIGRSRPPKALGTPLVSILIVFFSSTLFVGCDGLDSVKEKLKPIFNSKSNEVKETMSDPEGANVIVNAEFAKELYQTVFLREPTKDEFSSLMNSLEQNAHLEALYNGFIYSVEFRLKEKGRASGSALKVFSEILAELKLAQKYDLKNLEQLSNNEKPDVIDPEAKNTSKPIPTASEGERMILVNEIRKEGADLSFFSMKRILGEDLLKTIDLKKEYREKFATWYGKFAVFTNKYKVSFLLTERNNSDENYQYRWALHADEDRIKWESLARIHILMNTNQ